jgi:hypothetical protein
MIPLVHLQVVSTAADSVHLIYHCDACGRDSPAVVSAVSRGYGEALYGIGAERARGDAAAGAASGLPDALVRNVGLAGCPHCGHRSAILVRRAKLHALGAAFATWFGILVCLVIAAGVLGLVEGPGLVDKLIAAGVIVAGFLVVLPVAMWKYRRRIREAGTLVVWEAPAG